MPSVPTLIIGLQNDSQLIALASALVKAGWNVAGGTGHRITGFPWVVAGSGGKSLLVDIPSPPLLDSFDPDRLGMALVDETGMIICRWGLAMAQNMSSNGSGMLNPAMMGLVRAASRGQSASMLAEDLKLHASAVQAVSPIHVLILVTDAREEADAKRRAAISDRKADALKKIGKALTMHQTLQPMTVAAAHAISAATEMAAVLLWVRGFDDGPLELVASVGANRSGTSVLGRIDVGKGPACAAELAASRMKPIVVSNVHQNQTTSELEAKFCYLSPGGMMVWPLLIGSRLVGMLEVISRLDDHTFLDNQDLFATIAEHLSLALNSALLFENAERLATFDPLTGIANHRTMQEFLHKRLQEAQRTNSTVGAIMLDVDHFRRFNEEEGHDAGDKVLKLVAQVVKTSVRPYDLAARYGGEEFTVVMPGVTGEAAMAVAERVRKGIEEVFYASADGTKRQITASLGVAVFPRHASDAASLLKAADQALYEAKRTTRNRCVLFEGGSGPEIEPGAHSLLQVVRMLVRSEERTGLEMFLQQVQPQIWHVSSELSLSSNQLQALEAAAFLLPMWSRAASKGDESVLKPFRENSGLKSVVNCLRDIDERFDGSGPSGLSRAEIPLLTRILAVIEATARGSRELESHEPGRYDPDVVSIVLGSSEAA